MLIIIYSDSIVVLVASNLNVKKNSNQNVQKEEDTCNIVPSDSYRLIFIVSYM